MSRNRYNSYRSKSPNDRYTTRSQNRFSRSNSRNRSQNRFNRSNSRNDRSTDRYDRSNSRNRDSNNSSTRIRNRSSSIRRIYPSFKPGYNCRTDYDINNKSCTKCNDFFDAPKHQEFECAQFTVYSKTPCPQCRRGNHLKKDCDSLFLN